ncbi:hypothetical protein M514_06945 [Trichuris suis]|uniref:Non-specific serine/threonine protein kinase n=1 Tax=Trichuris suis TaxID=68888 RepID=A0A085NLH4_9BILA|nr:hypothetical protein M514_06945 [Trichuris suis]
MFQHFFLSGLSFTPLWCDMSTAARNRSKPSVNPGPSELIATVLEHEIQVKRLLGQMKDVIEEQRKCGINNASVSKLFAHLRNLRNQSSADRKAKADIVSAKWHGDCNLFKMEKWRHEQEFKCCGRQLSVGECESTTALLDEQMLNSWCLSTCEKILTAFVRCRDSARKFASTDTTTKVVIDGVVNSIAQARTVFAAANMSDAMRVRHQNDEKLLRSIILNIICDLNAVKNEKLARCLNCMLKTAVGSFLQNSTLDDLLWFTCKILQRPSVGVDWIPSLLQKVILSHCDASLKEGLENYCRFMFAIVDVSSLLHVEPKDCPIEVGDSWVVVELKANQATRHGPIPEEALRPYFDLLDMDSLGALSAKINSCEELTPLEKWNLHTRLTQYLICVTEATLKKFVDRRCYDTSLYLCAVTSCWISWLHCFRKRLADDLKAAQDRCVAEETYIRLSGYKAIVSVEKYSLWQSFLSMPITLGEPIDEWRLLYVIFRNGKDEIADVMKLPLHKLKGLVRETVRNTECGVNSTLEVVHFYNIVCSILERLNDADAVLITILALLLRAYGSKDPIERRTLEKNMVSIVRSSSLCVEQFIPALDECMKRPNCDCTEMVDALSFEQLRLNNKTWPILKSWLRQSIESKQFAIAERIVGVMALQHCTLADDAFTAELVDVLLLLFRKYVPDSKLSDVPTAASKKSSTKRISLPRHWITPFEQFCWSVIACVKVTKRPKHRGQSVLRTVFPTKHSLFEAFVHFQSGNESEVSVEDFLKAVTELRLPAAVLPCAIYLLCKPLTDETAVLPSADKFREWMDCLLSAPSDNAIDFPYGELFSRRLCQAVAVYRDSKPRKRDDVIAFLLETVCPTGTTVWQQQSNGKLAVLDCCFRVVKARQRARIFNQLLLPDGAANWQEEKLKQFVSAFDDFKKTDAHGHYSLKYPDLAFTFAAFLHDHVMAMNSTVPNRSSWRLTVCKFWTYICSAICRHRSGLLLIALRRLYEVVTSDQSLTGRELSELAMEMVTFLESKNCEFLKNCREELHSHLIQWIKDGIAVLGHTDDLLCFPRSIALEGQLMSDEELRNDEDAVAQNGPTAPPAETTMTLRNYTYQMSLIETDIVASVSTPTTAKDEKLTEVHCKTLRDGKMLMDWSDTAIIEVLTECIQRMKENVSVFKEIEKSLTITCRGFAASVKVSNLYVTVKRSVRASFLSNAKTCLPHLIAFALQKKLTYNTSSTVCPLCQSEAPAELTVEDHELDKVKGALLNEAWHSLVGSLDGHFEEFVDDFCDNFALFTCVLQEYSNRNEAPLGEPSRYDQAERSKLMDLMIASSACDDAAMPPEMCGGAAKSLRQTVLKAVLRRCDYEVNDILRTVFADSNTFGLIIQDLPVDLLTIDQFFVAYESFLRALTLPEGEYVNCRTVMDVLNLAQLEPKLTSSTVMSFLKLILSTYRDSKPLAHPNPEMCAVFNSHIHFLLVCHEMAHFESGLTLLLNADLSHLFNPFKVCNCLDCLNDCTPSSDGIAIALTLYCTCLRRKVDLWKVAMEKEGACPTAQQLDATVDEAYSFAAVRMMTRRDVDPQQWCSLLEQYYLIVRCLSNFFVETKCGIIENCLLSLVIAGLGCFNSAYLDERAKKVMDDYATEIKWNTVVPTIQIIDCFISFIASAKRKQKVFFIRVLVQLRWAEFVHSSLETLDSSLPTIARALELFFSCIFCNDAQPHSSSLVDLLDLFKLIPKATIVGESRQQLLLHFSTRATCWHLCPGESVPQNAAFRLLKRLMCFDGVGDEHSCAEVCTDSQRALLDVILEILKRRVNDSPAKKLVDAQWTPLLEEICACISLAANRFVQINRAKVLFNSAVSYLLDEDGNKAFIIDATMQWMKTSAANAYLIYLLHSLSQKLSAKSDVCLTLTEQCLKAYFADSISASWNDVIANFPSAKEIANELFAKCRQKCFYWVLYCHLLGRLYCDDGEMDIADLGLQSASICNELMDKHADELVCVMYLLLLTNTLSTMAQKSCTLTIVVLKQLWASLSALRRQYQPKGLIATVSLWKKPTRPIRFLLLCGIAEVFVVTLLRSDSALRDVYVEENGADAISMQTLKEMSIFEAYTNTIELTSEIVTSFQDADGMINLHAFVSKVALTLYSERCVADRCIV